MKTTLNRFMGLGLAPRLLAVSALLGLPVAIASAQTTYTPVFTNVWSIPAGTYADLPADANNTVRGIALSPVTTNVVYASRTFSNHVSTVSFAAGAFLGAMNGTGISGGTYGINGVRVAGDGAVYGCNLSTAPTSDFKIYRWPSDTDFVDAPTVVFDTGAGTSFQWRIGDYIDARGSGINTEIVAVGTGAGAYVTTNFVIFRPTDASCLTFTNFSVTIPGGAVNLCGGGIAFEGTNNAIWIRQASSANTRRVAYNPATLTATVTATNLVDQTACQGLKYFSSTNGVKLLASVQASSAAGAAQIGRVFEIPTNSLGAFLSVLATNLPAVSTGVNGNGLANVDAVNGYVVFGAPGNGVTLYQLGFITTAPPTASVSVSATTVIAGFNQAITCTASGSTPLSYQWYYDTNTLIVGATNAVYALTNIQTSNSGVYSVVVTNNYGKVTNYSSTINVLPNGSSLLTEQLWSVPTGVRDYVDTSDSQRGLAYDPISDQVILVSRSSTNGVHLLNAETGVDQGVLDLSALSLLTPAGTYPINVCGVGDDGVVYVCDLLLSATSDYFVIYSWGSASPSAAISEAYVGNPGIGRIGDVMAVRGGGVNTEILCSFRTGTNVALFNTADGADFNLNLISITNLPASAQANGFAGLGLAFGPGHTFWAKSSGFDLRLVSYDPVSGLGGVVAEYTNVPISESAIGADNTNGYVAAIGVTETPQSVAIYDASVPGGPSLSSLVDRKFFPTSNPNANGTGAIAVDTTGGRIFALDTDNGIIALQYAGKVAITQSGAHQVVSWATPTSILQSAPLLAGPYTDVTGAKSPYTNSTGTMLYYRLRH